MVEQERQLRAAARRAEVEQTVRVALEARVRGRCVSGAGARARSQRALSSLVLHVLYAVGVQKIVNKFIKI